MLAAQSQQAEETRRREQYQIDMGNTLQQYQSLPADQQPAFLATAAARMGPEFAQQLFNYSQEQFRQQGTATQQATTGGQQSQAQQAARDLEELRQRGNIEEVTKRAELQQRAARFAAAGGQAPGEGAALPFTVKPNQQVDLDPVTGQPRVSYPVGTPEWQQARSTVEATARAGQRIKELRALFKTYGTETWPTDVKARMSNIWGDIVADIAKSRGLGVLQAGELEMVKQQLPNPGAAGFSGALGFGGGLLGALDQLDSEVLKNTERDQRMFGHYPGMSLAPEPPAGFKPYRPAPAAAVKGSMSSGKGWK
jgi:hypothetical protein